MMPLIAYERDIDEIAPFESYFYTPQMFSILRATGLARLSTVKPSTKLAFTPNQFGRFFSTEPENLRVITDIDELKETLETEGKKTVKTENGDTADKLVVLYWHASWCGPCNAFQGSYKDAARTFPNVTFIKVREYMFTRLVFSFDTV